MVPALARPLPRLLASLLAGVAAATLVTFDNTKPRLDTSGAILDAHDNSLRRYPDGYFYLFAAAYGGCLEPAGRGCDPTPDHCGFQANHSVARFRSRTLASGTWERLPPVLAQGARPNGTVFGPGAVYNDATQRVVLQFNLAGSGYEGFPLFVAPAPDAPPADFAQQAAFLNVSVGGGSTGHFFVDPADGAAYFIYSANFAIHIERLAPDMLSVERGALFSFPEYFVEAPALFERKGVYYALFSWCCCYCMQGSGIIVHTAPHPLGPWTSLGEVACAPAAAEASGAAGGGGYLAAATGLGAGGTPTAAEGCQYKNASETSTTRAQQTFVVQVELADGSAAYIWTGDRWQQSPDGTKGHDPETWLPLAFDDAAGGAILPVVWQDSFTLDVAD